MIRLICSLSLLALLAATPLAQGTPTVQPGYTLYQPMGSTTTLLIDESGNTVHSWAGTGRPGNSVYLLEDGRLLRSVRHTPGGPPVEARIQIVQWDGTLEWDYVHPDPAIRRHHDVEMLPNGNVLTIAWRDIPTADAVLHGRNPATLSGPVFAPDSILEVQPTGPTTGVVVWEWNAIDHVIQDFDATKANFGVVEDHPELLDINFPLGVLNGGDWNHLNSVDYNAELDQIVVSSRTNSEIWIIDHSTTMAESAGHTGGNAGKGGDLLYRYGNPQAYRAGTATDRKFFAQHDAQWIPAGRPGAGNLLVFNNGPGRPEGQYSTVEEFVLPLEPGGTYTLAAGSSYGPAAPTWLYQAPNPLDFFSQNISGCERQPNGNTLIISGAQSWLFEVAPDDSIVWQFINMEPFLGNPAVFKARRYPECITVATKATEVVRLGTPPNPDVLRPGMTGPPILGTTWRPWVDHTSFFPTALVDVLILDLHAPVNVPTALGTLLCNVPSPAQTFVQFPIGTPFAITLPYDCAFAGVPVCTQGASLGGGVIQVTNAIDVVVGTY